MTQDSSQHSGQYGSQWIGVQQLPLDKDLAPVLLQLRAAGIEYRVSEVAGMQELAIQDGDQLARVQDLLDAFARGESLAPSQHDASGAADIRREIGQEIGQEGAFIGQNRSQPNTGIPLALQLRLFPVTLATLVLCALSFAAMSFLPGWTQSLMFTPFTGRGFASLDATLAAGEYWRLLSPIFLHFGVLHLIFNGVLVWWMGQRLEFALGSLRFALFIVIAALVSNYVQYAWSGHSNFGGISGVVYAFVGYVLVNQRITPIAAFGGLDAMLWFMVAWLVLGMTGLVELFMTAGGVANAAHLGGLLIGILLALVLRPRAIARLN